MLTQDFHPNIDNNLMIRLKREKREQMRAEVFSHGMSATEQFDSSRVIVSCAVVSNICLSVLMMWQEDAQIAKLKLEETPEAEAEIARHCFPCNHHILSASIKSTHMLGFLTSERSVA